MSDKRAEDIVKMYEAEKTAVGNFRSLYQQTSYYIYPRNDQITHMSAPGEDKTRHLSDMTAIFDSLEMASGLSQNLITPGHKFYETRVIEDANQTEETTRFLSIVTDITHERMFDSNFIMQVDESLRSLVVFGTGNLFSEYTTKLNYMDNDIGSFVMAENSDHLVDVVRKEFLFTARQAYQKWGDKCGEHIMKALNEPKKQEEKFSFLHSVHPRETRNPTLGDNLNMPYESLYIDMKTKTILDEGGFEEFPYHIARWSKSSNEIYGRGPGTFILPTVQMLQVIDRDVIECSNKNTNPPLSVLVDSLDGDPRTFPNAVNWVSDQEAIRSLYPQALGNYGIGKDILEAKIEAVHKAFFKDVFVPLSNLKGDRRTTLEIRERIGEGLQRLGRPIGRIQSEMLSPCIKRTMMLLFRNGQLPPPPPELQGKEFKIEYVGRLALELKSHQARGVQQWISDVAAIDQTNPELHALDNIEIDSSVRRLGWTYGVNAEDISTEEGVQAKRQAREEQIRQQQQLELAQMMAEGYGKTNKAAEPGSPAAQVQEAVS